MTDLWASLIAVVGTLGGATVAHIGARADRAADWREDRRHTQIAAVTALVEALAEHRRAMWLRENSRLAGDTATYATARTDSHATRAAVTGPLTELAILAPDLAGPADAAVSATYALRAAPTHDTLAARRQEAITAVDHLVTTAADRLGG